jgi:hypothetical protein
VIYFMQARMLGLIKIGCSGASLKTRQEMLQTGCPVPLDLLGVMPGDKDIESSLHRRFAFANEQGEWFRPVPELLQFILNETRRFSEEFARLVDVEPSLAVLWEEARNWHKKQDARYFCANAVFFGWSNPGGCFKDRISRLVGWHASLPELRTSEAYDIAYDTIYETLPNCRNCNCP